MLISGGRCHPLTFHALEMDFPLTGHGGKSDTFKAKPSNSSHGTRKQRRSKKKTPSRDVRPHSTRKPPSNSESRSMATVSTEVPKSGISKYSGDDGHVRRKRRNVDAAEEESLSSSSSSSSADPEPRRNHDSKRRRVDEISHLQSFMESQYSSQLQGKFGNAADENLNELSSRVLQARLLGNVGANPFSSMAVAAPSASFYVPNSAQQHVSLSTASQLSDLLRNCGLGAAVASLPNQGLVGFFDRQLPAPFLRQHQRPIFPFPTAASAAAAMGGVMPMAAADYYNSFAAPASLLPQPTAGNALDANLAAAWLRMLEAPRGFGARPNVAHGAPFDCFSPISRSESTTSSTLPAAGLGFRREDSVSEPAEEQVDAAAAAATTITASTISRPSRSNERKATASARGENDGDKKPPAVVPNNVEASRALPPCDEGEVLHYSERPHISLATDEDQNWLSEFLCFVRSELVEVFRASREDVASRLNSKKVSYGQVGIRCRYCAHLPHNARASRSSSFPSSVGRIYQSLTMMLREHFGHCKAIPQELKDRFLDLKSKTSQGATNSKRYWVHSAMKLGMTDSTHGIWITEQSQSDALMAPPFGTPDESNSTAMQSVGQTDHEASMPIVTPNDRELVSEFLYMLMTQVQRISLTESERVGSRKNLPIGLPGIGCRHCCPSNRRGLCRFFPARRRTLPNKVNDLYNHIRRCTLCPDEIKDKLAALEQNTDHEKSKDSEGERAFFDQVWTRLGH